MHLDGDSVARVAAERPEVVAAAVGSGAAGRGDRAGHRGTRATESRQADTAGEEQFDDHALHPVGVVRMAMIFRATSALSRTSLVENRYGATRAALPPITLSRTLVVSFTGRLE